eukprot:IDg19702t1
MHQFSLHILSTRIAVPTMNRCTSTTGKARTIAHSHHPPCTISTFAMAEVEMTRSKLGKSYPKAEVEATHAQCMQELRSMYTKTACADCGAKPANWATLKRPAFVCINCAQKLRADSSNRVKNCIGTYLWHPDEMELIRSLKKHCSHRCSSLSSVSGLDVGLRCTLGAVVGRTRGVGKKRRRTLANAAR